MKDELLLPLITESDLPEEDTPALATPETTFDDPDELEELSEEEIEERLMEKITSARQKRLT